ncbi:MAG: TVP38/TMEM64 family protein [Candidatus Coproplasma sp.]
MINHNIILMVKNGNNKSSRLNSKKAVSIAVNVLSAVFFTLLAFVFFAYGYKERALAFIDMYYAYLLWSTVGILSGLLILYLIFFALSKQALYRFILCALICLDLVAVLFYALSATDVLSKITSVEKLREYIESFGAWAVIIFIVFQFLQVVILPIPGSVSVGVGVALFGPLRCSIFSFIGILAGSFVAFALGRWVGYKAVCWVVGKDDLDKWLKKLKGKDYLILSLMFLLPLFPDDVLCFVAGLSSMTWIYYTVMIIITRFISVTVTSFSLQLIPFTTWWGILIWVIIAVLVGFSFRYVCKYSDKIDKFIKGKLKPKKKRTKR